MYVRANRHQMVCVRWKNVRFKDRFIPFRVCFRSTSVYAFFVCLYVDMLDNRFKVVALAAVQKHTHSLFIA